MSDGIDIYFEGLKYAFFSLCFEGIIAEIADFLEENPDFNKFVVNSEGQNALLFAARIGHFELFKYLLEEHHFDINSTDFAGRNSLHLACIFNYNLDIISYLVEQSPNFDLDHCDNAGNSPIHLASLSPIPSLVIPYLVSHNFGLDWTNHNGHTLANIASSNRLSEVSYIIDSINNPASELIESEAPISEIDSLDRRESPKDSPSVRSGNCLISNPIVFQHQI